MKAEEHAAMGQLEDSHWYFRGKRRVVAGVLDRELSRGTRRRILDIGCGAGATLQLLSSYGDVFGADASADALAFCRNRGLTRLTFADGGGLPFATGSFDLVSALDVLEHLEDDVTLVREMARVLKPGGLAVVTVPAFQFLWSDHDVALHHFRRYRAPRLRRALESGGLTVQRMTYFNTLLFPAACAVRLFKRESAGRDAKSDFFTPIPAWLNATLARVFGAEAHAVSRMGLPFGLSLLSVARLEPGEGAR